MSRLIPFCMVLLVGISHGALGQQNSATRSAPEDPPRSTAVNPAEGLLKLDVVVTDPSGKPVSGLKPTDFTLLDGGQAVKVVTFHAFDGDSAKPDPPVEVILAIDELNLPPVQLSAAEKEAERFLVENQSHLDLPVVIYRISQGGLSVSARPSGADLMSSAMALNGVPRWIWQTQSVVPSQGWGAGDGVFFPTIHNLLDPALHDLPHSLIALGSIAIEERRKPGRKLLFWLGPGWPYGRGRGVGLFDFVTEMSTRLREARVEVWDVTEWPLYDGTGRALPTTEMYQDFLDGVTSAKKLSFGNLGLQVFATQSGGGVLSERNHLDEAMEKRVEESSEFYTLTFDPAQTREVDEYRALKLEVDKPDLTVHTRTGYYDEPVFYDQPDSQAKRITVDELERALGTMHGDSDGDAARQLSHLELTERLSSANLSHLQGTLRGKKSKAALVALADGSVFLAPPASSILATAPPDALAQRVMLQRMIDYASRALLKLPDFFAQRTTVQYDEPAPKEGQTWKTGMGDQSLRVAQTAKGTMVFRNGKEVVKEKVSKAELEKRAGRTLDTAGTFGPILAMVVEGASAEKSELSWSRWEQGANGAVAVFRYAVPQSLPLFEAGFCCLANDFEEEPFRERTGFHGEFAIDPASGAVLRLTVEADLEPRLPLERSDIMVEYAPVVMGGTTYICPIRSVSISRQRTVKVISEWGEVFKVYGPFETILDDVMFDKYHLFRSESHILPGFTPANDEK
jgi:VWFA-related protein